MNEDTIERIELKIAFLERANHDLSNVVYRQQREIEELRTRLAALVSGFAALKLEHREYTEQEERPPHY